LTLRVAVGMSTEETAAALGMSSGAVRVAQHRALTKLRELLAEEAGVAS
jgi:RNA polymerase sigma-70 factor, ECF subfamily